MNRLIAATLVAVVAILFVSDPLWCADGCIRSSTSADSSDSQHLDDCQICHPGIALLTVELPAPPLADGTRVEPVIGLLLPAPAPPDQPPRFA